MIDTIFEKYSNKFISKWLILIIDLSICILSFLASTLIIYDFHFPSQLFSIITFQTFLVICVRLFFFFWFQSYAGIIRHTSLEDTYTLFKTLSTGSFVLLALSSIATTYFNTSFFRISVSVVIVDYFVSLFILIVSRLFVKRVFETFSTEFGKEIAVIIYGGGELGIVTKNSLLKNQGRYKILCYIDDNLSKINKTIEGIKVLSMDKAIDNYIKKNIFPNLEVIFAIQNIDRNRRREILDEFLKYKVNVKSVPPINKWINRELNEKQIKHINIEDLLERNPIQINNNEISKLIENKVILVTGGAGSIGSEIVRQLFNFLPKRVVVVDQAESMLYDLEQDLKKVLAEQSSNIKFSILPANITDVARMEVILSYYRPEIIFHAAAYKHVPLMENNPYESVKTNVFGTKSLADMAMKIGVKKFVMISTDKAVNPTNVMGATKRVAEIYVNSLNSIENDTQFIVTRFGNVLGSNGSVIPLFKKQIEVGGPITVTHPEITRYFMTIPEACQLVLEAGTMGKGGEVYVFDMGEPVKIVELAKKMIRLSGLQYGKDIDITYSGLRPGEKLYEELLNNSENTIKTYHPKITIAKVSAPPFYEINRFMISLEESCSNGNDYDIVQKLKEIVPEYISNNSIFERLDTPPNKMF